MSCKEVGRIHVTDPFAYVREENDCPDFEARLIDINAHGEHREYLVNLLENLKRSPVVGKSIREFTKVPSTSHFWTSRGLAMLELSDDDLPSFEGDNEFKLYKDISNHVFADLLVPVSRQIKSPIIFWVNSGDVN